MKVHIVIALMLLVGGGLLFFNEYQPQYKQAISAQPTQTPQQTEAPKPPFNDIERGALYRLVNDYRTEKSINVLYVSSDLEEAAQLKANDMDEKGYWDHNAPDGTKPWNFFQKVGYDYTHAGENLAKGFYSTEFLLDSWIDSPTHNKNLINKEFEEMGVGYVCSPDTQCIVVMFYGEPKK